MAKKLDKVDVVTVGMGWAGGIVATELTKAGFQVVGLERGGDRSIEDYLHGHDELKYSVRRQEIFQSLSKDTVTFRNTLDETAAPIRNQGSLALGTGVGGGGSHYAAQTHRYFAYDFEIRSKTIERYGESKIPEDMTIQDWGITYDELEPYYDKMEKTAAVSGEVDPLADKRSNPFPTPAMKRTPAMKLFHEASESLGYHPFVIPGAIASESYTNPDGVAFSPCQYCAFCTFHGCEYGAKADPALMLAPVAKKTGKFELRTHSLVTRVLYTGNKATGVLYKDVQTGEEFEQPADLVVLSSYTLNNVRLLLLSGIGKQYDPKTGQGVVGKNLLEHHNLLGAHGYFNEEKFNLYVGTGNLGETFTDFNGDNFDHATVDFIHGGQIEFRQGGDNPIRNNPVPNGTPLWGKEFKKQSLHYVHRKLSVTGQRSNLPTRNNYMDLDPSYKDEYGDPLLRMTVDYTDQDRKLNEFLVDKAAEVLKEMGADIIDKDILPEHFGGGFTFQHNAGGVIMGDNPETSAVNNYLQMWDMDNLFVCGASAFPHFGGPNPTLTMGALTYRATEGMIQYLKNGGGQLVAAKKEKQLI